MTDQSGHWGWADGSKWDYENWMTGPTIFIILITSFRPQTTRQPRRPRELPADARRVGRLGQRVVRPVERLRMQQAHGLRVPEAGQLSRKCQADSIPR